jgi:hypothetical protein
MSKKPRRTLAQYRLDVNIARIRRNAKELENKQLFQQNGEPCMRMQQEMLMNNPGHALQPACGVAWGGDVPRSVDVVMRAVVVKITKQLQPVDLSNTAAIREQDNGDGVVCALSIIEASSEKHRQCEDAERSLIEYVQAFE